MGSRKSGLEGVAHSMHLLYCVPPIRNQQWAARMHVVLSAAAQHAADHHVCLWTNLRPAKDISQQERNNKNTLNAVSAVVTYLL